MKPTFLLASVTFFALLSCNNDDGRTCTTCTNEQTTPFELCRESNGNASVNGEDTGTSYDTYLSGLEALGTSCGG
ncbi:MAG: hypothetical protein K0U54_05760 [Bacteroidetes bacterium]|nr:hypothetical protein [Bacteroidota bacterium]